MIAQRPSGVDEDIQAIQQIVQSGRIDDCNFDLG
jgi:hypothetical protein